MTHVPPLNDSDWKKAADEFLRNSLTRAQTSCEKWAATISTLMGVFALVAIVKGTTVITEVPGLGNQIAIVVLIVAAAVTAFLAIIWAALGAQGGVDDDTSDNWDADAYRALVRTKSTEAREFLRKSRKAGVAAAVIVLCAAVWLLIASIWVAPSPPHAQVLIVNQAGQVVAGEVDISTGAVTVNGQAVSGVNSVTLLEPGTAGATTMTTAK